MGILIFATFIISASCLPIVHGFSHGPSRQAPFSRQSPLKMSAITQGNGGGVVITGAAGGVGFAYAAEFMDRGYSVTICDVKDCSAAAKALAAKHSNGKIFHTKCDVSDIKQVEALGKFAKTKMGNIGYWINNAGINGGRRPLMEVPNSTVELVVKVNLLGVLFGTKVAMDIMKDQNGFTGEIFNTVGSGVKGGGTPGKTFWFYFIYTDIFFLSFLSFYRFSYLLLYMVKGMLFMALQNGDYHSLLRRL